MTTTQPSPAKIEEPDSDPDPLFAPGDGDDDSDLPIIPEMDPEIPEDEEFERVIQPEPGNQ